MRRLRVAFSNSGLARSFGVMLSMMPRIRLVCLSAALKLVLDAACAMWLGNLSIRLAMPPICCICTSWSRKSPRSNPPLEILFANFSALATSTFCWACSTKARISPIPKMRLAIRSASNASRPSIFSATPINFSGTPVIWRTDSAAPPRESPSSLVRMTPVSGSASWNALAVLTASCPSIASTTNKVSIGLRLVCKVLISCMSASSIPKRPAVSTKSTSK